MDFGSYNKFWVVVEIMVLKSALNLAASGIGLLEIILGCRNVGLWENPELFGYW